MVAHAIGLRIRAGRRRQRAAMFSDNLHGRGARSRLDARIVLAEMGLLHRDSEGPLQGWPLQGWPLARGSPNTQE